MRSLKWVGALYLTGVTVERENAREILQSGRFDGLERRMFFASDSFNTPLGGLKCTLGLARYPGVGEGRTRRPRIDPTPLPDLSHPKTARRIGPQGKS